MPARGRSRAYARLVLRITDARTGALVDAAPARRGLTRIEAHTSGFDPTNLRVLLVADLLVRALELGGTPVWAMLSGERERAELRAAGAALGVRPLEDAHDAGTGLGEAQVLHVLADDSAAAPEGVRVAVAPAHGEGIPGASDGTDPAALRLALLSRPRGTAVRLGAEDLDEAARTLAEWRGAVAGWAHHPSRPIPDPVRADLRAAWENDLDVPGVLRVLREVASVPGIPDGARFETYAYADRLLGVDLTRDLGTPA
ncbi:hypothetical protein HCJ93_19625 [Streptomyces sp. SBST2-5]|mgnify:CR=1 FL=1|uniref:Cysteinyl-tRNA synthetase n=1 Tax=Streptomyces composti TaxID=2720025 RepID=A0ABX1AED8_9ACTN|nr:hypothetical protein [Streptomyces composti]NJP52198.1 hypothetical protein [Streptomyces composti]